MAQSVKFSDITFLEIYIIKQLGNEKYSNVHKAKWYNKTIAVKEYFQIDQFSEEILKEKYSELLYVNHENILKFYGTSEYHGRFCSKSTFLIMEYADCGSLYEQIHGTGNHKYTTITALHWMLQCAKGVAFLHSMRPRPIIHGNLKPLNLFLTNHYRQLKIGELDIMTEWQSVILANRELAAYMPPEGLHSSQHREKYDVYSFGIVLWEVLARRKPFNRINQLRAFPLVDISLLLRYHPPLTDVPEYLFSGNIRSLIEGFLDHEPQKRPDMEAVATSINNYMSSFIDRNITFELSDIELDKIIGFGAFGVVYKAKLYDKCFAVKKYFVEDDIAKKGIAKEVKYLSQVSHQNIIKLFGTVVNKESKTMIIMEFADCGTLYNYLHQEGAEKQSYTYLIALNWMHQLAQGIKYLHAMKPRPIIHRDIKTKNLLLVNNYRTLKIADFGTVTEQATLMTRNIGTPEYMAPEVVEGGIYTEKSDVYSFGIVLWEVMSQKKPFYHLKNNLPLTIINLVSQGVRPPIEDVKKYPNREHIKTLIQNCWDLKQENRSSMRYLVFMLCFDF